MCAFSTFIGDKCMRKKETNSLLYYTHIIFTGLCPCAQYIRYAHPESFRHIFRLRGGHINMCGTSIYIYLYLAYYTVRSTMHILEGWETGFSQCLHIFWELSTHICVCALRWVIAHHLSFRQWVLDGARKLYFEGEYEGQGERKQKENKNCLKYSSLVLL